MAKNKSSCSSSVCHSPPPLFTATGGGGFWLGKAVPCLSLSRHFSLTASMASPSLSNSRLTLTLTLDFGEPMYGSRIGFW
uniref:Uncharacterized protein n=1 Tax=Fagus sylvatica TaxID=28930 RepID=A0A2N9FWR2_FAGSY